MEYLEILIVSETIFAEDEFRPGVDILQESTILDVIFDLPKMSPEILRFVSFLDII